ncbi:uncharacterized protein KRP23_15182 [Phytophthora ramorum]|uniref:uncharacterized protein n=1 Tax=Phytophthora ramorum TaxID=164328 RepID=UPI0030AA72F7|nr:hypothetical protein KRP23_15182 [Phytophthora ramorum]
MQRTSIAFSIVHLLLVLPVIASAAVTSTGIAASTDPLAQQLLQKTWTVSTVTLDTLEVHVAGNVFVDYDDSLNDQTSAKIVMRASKARLLDAVDVSDIDNGLRLRYKNQQMHVESLVTTHILLSKPNALREVSATNSQNVVLGENVVENENQAAGLHFSTHGSGHIFVGAQTVDVRSVGVVVSGDGGVQFQASSLKIGEELTVSLGARASWLSSLTPKLQAETLAAEIVGNGHITYEMSGVCGNEKIRLAGEGSVSAGSIACKNADVSILGTGEAVVQATERLSTMLLLTGSVKYVNGRPQSIQTSGLVLESSIEPAEAVPKTEFTPASPPSRVATGVFLTVEVANNNDNPYVHVRPVVETSMRLQNLSASLPESMSALVLFEVAIVAMAFVAVSAFKFQQRRIRNKYQTLP